MRFFCWNLGRWGGTGGFGEVHVMGLVVSLIDGGVRMRIRERFSHPAARATQAAQVAKDRTG